MKSKRTIFSLGRRLFAGIPGRSDESAVWWTMKNLERNRTGVFMELEQGAIHFRTTLAVKNGVVVVAKPQGLTDTHLKKHSFVRIVGAEPFGDRDIRLEVIVPHFNLVNGNIAFLCRMPVGFVEGSRRKSVRYNTSRFKNLYLILPRAAASYRIADISEHGAKVLAHNGGMARSFPLDVPLPGASLHIGKLAVPLKAVIPRAHRPPCVGVEFVYSESGKAEQYVHQLVRLVEEIELKQMRSGLSNGRQAGGEASPIQPDVGRASPAGGPTPSGPAPGASVQATP